MTKKTDNYLGYHYNTVFFFVPSGLEEGALATIQTQPYNFVKHSFTGRATCDSMNGSILSLMRPSPFSPAPWGHNEETFAQSFAAAVGLTIDGKVSCELSNATIANQSTLAKMFSFRAPIVIPPKYTIKLDHEDYSNGTYVLKIEDP